MEKRLKTLLIFLVSLLFFSVFVLAVGSSSGGSSGVSSDSSGGSSSDSSFSSSTTTDSEETEKINCELIVTVSGRIKCRFENKNSLYETGNEIEEACRSHYKTNDCISLYENSATCYNMVGNSKQRCFIQKAGLLEGQNLVISNDENKRNYIILLLYEIQERIEDSYDEGKISSDNAANLVALIVEIKRDILLDKSKNEIKPKVQSFKIKYKEIIR